jgi:azurin
MKLGMDNQGALEHNWAVVKSGEEISSYYNSASDDAKLLFNAGVLAAGTKKNVDFTAPLPGEYKIVCTVPGHFPLMQGKLVVK